MYNNSIKACIQLLASQRVNSANVSKISSNQFLQLIRGQSSYCRVSLSMPPKRNERRAISPAVSIQIANVHTNESNSPKKDDSIDLSKLQPKPCHCCGREITPRSKWKRNWDEIRFCSDQCRSWPGTIKVFTYKGDEEFINATGIRSTKSIEFEGNSNLERCINRDEGEPEKDTPLGPKHQLLIHELDLDAWIESSILSVAQQSSKSTKFKTLQDVAQVMDDDMDKISDVQLGNAIHEYLKHSHTGLRELIRRAARRLVVLPSDSWACTKRNLLDLGENQKVPILTLTQQNGRHKITTLSDVSHAKGEIEISIEKA
jgi:hypothetical protein